MRNLPFILCGVFGIGWSTAAEARAQTPPPNFLIIVIDDMGTEKLAMYDQYPPHALVAYPPTPQLDLLRSQGILFTNAYVTPLCSPTRASIQTGRYGFRTGVGNLIGPGPTGFDLPDSEVLLSELLKDGLPARPYACGAFGKWHLGNGAFTVGTDIHPIRNGYDVFMGTQANQRDHFSWTMLQGQPGTWQQSPVAAPPYDEPANPSWDADVNCTHALRWIHQQSSPWLAYVAFNPVHYPFQVPPFYLLSPATQTALVQANLSPGNLAPECYPACPPRVLVFNAMIEALDTVIGKLVAGLDAANTNIIVLADNGTEGTVVEPPFSPRHAKDSLYQPGIRIPFLVAGSWVAPANQGAVCPRLVNGVDMWSTLADYSNANTTLALPPGPPAVAIDGVSIRSLIDNPTTAPNVRNVSFSENYQPNGLNPTPATLTYYLRAVNDENYKYMRIYPPPPTGVCNHVFSDPCPFLPSASYLERFYFINGVADEHDDILCHSSLSSTEQNELCFLRQEMMALVGP